MGKRVTLVPHFTAAELAARYKATRRARSRAGLMTTNPQDARAVDHWESVLAELRDEAASQGDGGSSDNGVRAQLIP